MLKLLTLLQLVSFDFTGETKESKVKCKKQEHIQYFSEVVPDPKGEGERGANLLFDQSVPKNCMKMKKIWPRGRKSCTSSITTE